MPTALVIDDVDDIRLLIRDVLERNGFEVTEAAGGTEALRTLSSPSLPDVVVLDVQMPEIDGWEVLATVRSRSSTAHLRVVLCTVKGGHSDALRAWELGCDAYVTKPFSIVDLGDEVVRVAGRTEQEREAVRVERLCAARAAVTVR